MKQYKITSWNLTPAADTDCVLDPNDPVHKLMPVAALGGLGSGQALAEYRAGQLPTVQSSNKGQVAREQGIQPGTDEWFKHWFGK
jgi:hypothetical protein